ncbi:Cytochrome b5 reductase 4 [Melipona quadrifasciata]|uniref:Cytochrome b5 reductase 4 n=1 Tax=Melipona quadrifasciata TaxID=166423 RepID=A0A0N0BD10_9HYME|nr:Cytochrome b5 reductase 4 [Melipona quadrifasciata]
MSYRSSTLSSRVCGTPLGWVRTSLVGLVTTSVWGKESLPSAPLMSLGSDSETKRKTIAFHTPTPYLYLRIFPFVLPQHPSQHPLPLTPLPDLHHKNPLENTSAGDLSSVKMEWKQTIESVTFSYKITRNNPSLGYELSKLTNTRVLFKIIFENDIIVLQLNLRAEVEWPPTWSRNHETMKAEFTFTKREKRPWMNYGFQSMGMSTGNLRVYREYQVVSNEPLSNLIHLLVVRAKEFVQIVPIGRYVQVQLDPRRIISRSYVPVPPYLHPNDMAPNYTNNCLCLMIKKYPNGFLSPSITALQVGQTLNLSNSTGSFVIGNYDRYSVIHMLAGGTGLTVMLGIIQRALVRRSVKTINLLNFNKDEENMFYVQQLKRVSGEKLKVTHILSQPKSTWTGRRGMVSDELLNELVGTNNPEACVFICGPPLFLQAAKTSLRDHLDWKSHQMYEFQ